MTTNKDATVLERAIIAVLPNLLLEGTPWKSTWELNQKQDFVRLARFVFPLIAVGYIAHYYFFDRVVGLEPIEHWRTFRFSMAGIALTCFAIYSLRPLHDYRWYKLPAAIACATFCYFQGRVLVWYQNDLYFYAFAFLFAAAIILRTTVLISVCFSLIVLALLWPSFVEAGFDEPFMLSAASFTLLAIVFVRSSYSAEVRYFISQQRNLTSQREIIELNIEFTDRLRSFLPKEISRRLEQYVSDRHMTVLQAAEEVLKPKKRFVSCLFTDIRGFTASTQESSSYVTESVLPNVRECTNAIEEFGGIPRKIGDLVFAYFDLTEPEANAVQCLLAGLRVLEANDRANQQSAKEPIRRFVLISSGEAVVGNLGGFDSSVEITALGNPVNFLARLDEQTKHPRLAPRLSEDELILDSTTAELLRRRFDSISLKRIDLLEIDINIRDFSNVDEIFTFAPSKLNKIAIMERAKNSVGPDIGATSRATKQPEDKLDSASAQV